MKKYVGVRPQMKSDTALDKVCKVFGGQNALAREIGVDKSTVSGWRKRGGHIPSWRHQDVIAAANRLGLNFQRTILVNADMSDGQTRRRNTARRERESR